MVKRYYIYILTVILAVFFVSGCQTVPKKVKEEMSGISSRVDTLESRVEGVESKQAEAEHMTSEQTRAIEELRARKEKAAPTNISIKHRPSKSKSDIKEIQTYLSNAGFYRGKIDGIRGKMTTKAIKDFQEANGLKADGIVGPKTWESLSKYVYGSPSRDTEEGATK